MFSSSPPTRSTNGTPSEFINALNHMNADHPSSLRSIVQSHLSLSRPPYKAQMTKLDSRGFEVEYTVLYGFQKGGKVKSGIRIPWSRKSGEVEEITGGSREVRERLVEMVKESEANRNKKYPILYSPPTDLPLSLLLIALLIYISKPQNTPTSLYNSPRLLYHLHTTLPLILKITGIVHILEALGIFALALTKGSSLKVASLWAATTLPVGFPSFFKFRLLNPATGKLEDKKAGRGGEKKKKEH